MLDQTSHPVWERVHGGSGKWETQQLWGQAWDLPKSFSFCLSPIPSDLLMVGLVQQAVPILEPLLRWPCHAASSPAHCLEYCYLDFKILLKIPSIVFSSQTDPSLFHVCAIQIHIYAYCNFLYLFTEISVVPCWTVSSLRIEFTTCASLVKSTHKILHNGHFWNQCK